MPCPKCGGKLQVIRSLKTSKLNVRTVECLGCRARYETQEVLTSEIVGDVAIPIREPGEPGEPAEPRGSW